MSKVAFPRIFPIAHLLVPVTAIVALVIEILEIPSTNNSNLFTIVEVIV